MNFVAVCRAACLAYYDVWDEIERRTTCDCNAFSYQECRHITPNDHLCKWVEVCEDSATYQLEVCAPTACGSTAQNEADWRKCGAAAAALHAAALVAAVVLLLANLL